MSRWRTQHSPDILHPALREWFRTPVGQTVLQEEQALIVDALSDRSTAGRCLLKLSAIPERCNLEAAFNQRQFNLGNIAQYGFSQVLDAVCDFHQLPIANESQDIVVLHHLLEFVENPHKVLREVERVLVPHGKVVVCGINPWSLLGLRGRLGRLKRSAMWQNHSLSINRINDWLSLLGFESYNARYAFHRLPINRPAYFMNHASLSSQVPLGGVFVLAATKYREPLTPAADFKKRGQILRHPSLAGATRNVRD
ncbi:MAG: class I SAM-dependent methyltransferase [Spongiibacter sp.]|nr:class I SAM-dependent methyltransferase [Spongiibacter sp.]